MKKYLLSIVLLFAASELFAQGFNMISGRNHPHLNWQVAETEHFLIMYPERLSGIEAKAAPIAEETYRALSENLDVQFSSKIRMYLSDEDEINNGYAVPIGKGYTNMWVNTNDYSEIWTGSEKWLRKLIAHELAHIFHFKAVWSPIGMWNWVIGDPTPSFWTEGLAQYQTERWDSQRGDRWLRKAIFDSRPGYNDGQSLENGRLRYASGNSQMRYFTEKYGDSTLVEMLSQREKFLKLFEYHDFPAAFSEVVDGGYSAFYEDWRKHMNVYYNTLASQMERTDSLRADVIPLPGQFYYDMAVSPDGSKIAVLSFGSMQRPVRRLFTVQNDSTRKTEFVAEGGINTDISWSSDGSMLYYSRTNRGNHGAIVNDIYSFDLEKRREKRITESRRARFPVEGPDDSTITYIVNENGTGNLFARNTETGEESRITNFSGDIQVMWLVWIPSQNSWLIHRFEENGDRHLVLINRETGAERIIDKGVHDNRKPVLSPDETRIAYTSLRDEVPNVFIYSFEDETETRHTNLFTGGDVYGWIAADDTLQNEKILVKASETKRRDEVYWVDAGRTPFFKEIELPESYSGWRQKSPPAVIPSFIEPDETLIQDRYRYSSFKNITHAASLALPYYAGPDDWGIFATTNWAEPLGKHLVSVLGWVSIADPGRNSFGSANYINNRFFPTIGFSLYKLPESARFYGDHFLVDELTGGEINIRWPLDLFAGPYRGSNFFARARHVLVRPYEAGRFDDSFLLPAPEKARQTDLRLGWSIKKQRPWRDNIIHPLDGSGLSISATGAENILGSDVSFLTTDLNAFAIFPAIGLHRIFTHVRLQAQWGEPLPQNFIGFSRYDNINLNLPNEVPLLLFNEAERVRGYRNFAAGRQVAFGSIEYRMPFLPSLNTSILGLLSLGRTSLALFSDAGAVWEARMEDGTTGTDTRWGAGAELKNHVTFLGIGFTHSLGIARPAQELFSDTDAELYYRIRAVVPF